LHLDSGNNKDGTSALYVRGAGFKYQPPEAILKTFTVFLSSATQKSVLYIKLGHDSYLTYVHNPLFTDHPIIHCYAM